MITVATLASTLCGSTELRFLDLGDGTVRDCNTGKMWLKDAACIFGTWDGTAPFDASSVQAEIDDLNDTSTGTDFGCRDYVEGTYTDWRLSKVSDFCTAGEVAGECPVENADDSIIDSSLPVELSKQRVRNAAGDGRWSEEDAFVGVWREIFWTANEGPGANPWVVTVEQGILDTVLPPTSSHGGWPVRDP